MLVQRRSAAGERMTTFNGSPGPDIFTGGSGADTALGAGGNDLLIGGDGNDILVGNAGADSLIGGNGDDVLFSGDQTPPWNGDSYYGSSNSPPVFDTGTEVDTLSGGDGSDKLFAGYGDNVDGGANGSYGDYLYISFMGAPAGVTADFRLLSQVIGGGTITGIENLSWVQGSNFNDDINAGDNSTGYATFAVIQGMGGNDHLVAGYYTGILDGGDGNDVLDGRGGQYLSEIDGGNGDDLIYTPSNAFTAAYGGGGNDTIYAFGPAHGGSGDDLIIGQDASFRWQLSGDDGNDEIRASNVGSVIAGGTGSDTLIGGAGSDELYSADLIANTGGPADDMGLEHDRLTGGGGDDELAIGYGDDADGGTGIDTLRLSLGGVASGITLNTGGIVSAQPYVLGAGTIQNFETLGYLRGTEFNDVLTLATQDSLLTVDAGAGDDVIYSSSSSVSVLGGAGDDRFVSGPAGDIFDGGAGSDTVDYSDYASGVTASLAAGVGAGGDQLANVENIIGGSFNDTLAGDDGDNVLDGGAGSNTVSYADANFGVMVSLARQGMAQDTVGAGVDTLSHFQNLIGSSFSDVLTAGAGAETLTGGSGVDTFVLAPGVGDIVIADFQPDQETIDLTAFGFSSIAALKAAEVSAGSSTTKILFPGGGSLTVNGLSPSVTNGLLLSDTARVSVSVSDPTGRYASSISAVIADATQAFNAWTAYLAPSAALIKISITMDSSLRSPTLANGGPTDSGFVQTVNGIDVFAAEAAQELLTSVNFDGSLADIDIHVSTSAIDRGDLWIDPLNGSGPPSGRSDLVDVLTHEIGHGLAFIGWRDDNTLALPSDYESPFDSFVTSINGVPYFTGPHAEAVYGGPVPLTVSNIFHVGNDAPLPGSNLSSDIMFATNDGRRYVISALDVAILSDCGLATVLSDTLIGSFANDTIFGGAGDDVISGEEGDDVLNGGAGADTFVFGPGGAADTVTDFSAAQGDRVDLTAFSSLRNLADVLALSSQSGADTLISLTGESVRLSNVQMGSLTFASFVLTPPPATFVPLAKTAADFNGDGRFDVAFRNTAAGDWGYMSVTGSGGETWHGIGVASTAYDVIGEADFNGDGIADLAFRNAAAGDWGYMALNSSGAGETWHGIGPASTAYVALGAGDFNGDGVADLAFRNAANGSWGYMALDRSGAGEAWHDMGSASTYYVAMAIGDFNKDGAADLAFRNATTGDWGYMSTSSSGEVWHPIGSASVDYAPVAVADFNKDGALDVAFRNNATGDFGYMSVIPSGGEAWHPLGPTSTAYAAVAVGDFDANGVPDVAFRNTATGDWGFMTPNLGGSGQTWHPVGPASTGYGAV